MATESKVLEAAPTPAAQPYSPARESVPGPYFDSSGKVVFPKAHRGAKIHPVIQNARGALLQSAGNQAVQRLVTGLGGESLPAGLAEGLNLPGRARPAAPPLTSGSQAAGIPQAGPEAEQASPAAGEQKAGAGTPGAPAAKTAAGGHQRQATPESDAGFQAVTGQVRAKSKQGKAPPIIQGAQAEQASDRQIQQAAESNSEIKRKVTQSAAQLPLNSQEREAGEKGHLAELDQTAQKQPMVTVEDFMKSFEDTVQKLADKLPKNDDERGSDVQAAQMGAEKEIAKQALAEQNQAHAGPYREALKKDSSAFQKTIGPQTAPGVITADDPGGAQAVPGAQAAAPKPKKADEVSLEDKSRDLDDLLAKNNVNGHTVSVDEGSLAYPVSGEQSFDEAGEAKRKAQDEIQKAGPKYRQEEAAVLNQSKAEVRSLVSGGLNKQLGARSQRFGEIHGQQKTSEDVIVNKKQEIFDKFHKTYEATKQQVADDLKLLDNIEGLLGIILAKENAYFESHLKQQLEYIYTPGVLDYSDWIDEKDVQEKIKQEYQNITGGESSGFNNLNAMMKARRNVQDEYAKQAFTIYKEIFIDGLRTGIKEMIAPVVVTALNLAKTHVILGQQKVKTDYDQLSEDEKAEAETVYNTVNQKFGLLAESVDAKKTEIINDLARAYNKDVGKLDAKFEEIKKDVLTSWWEKAWNKIKAVVMAIIEFASRLFSLLGRLVYLAGDIISSPRAFFSNLVSGIGQGFSTFANHIDTYLATAFFDWLRGSSGPTIQLPSDFGPSGLFSLFMQILGLSTETIWERMEVVYTKAIANAFRRGEQVVSKGLEVFEIIRNEGLGGLWEHIKDSLGDILSETLDNIKESILYAAIQRVIIEIGKLLIPGGGFIAIAGKIIDLLKFIVEARDRILDLIESFVDSVEMAVKGDLSGIASKVIQALTRFITIAIDFLVSFFGLSDLHDKVVSVLNRIRQPVVKGIDWVLNKLKPLVMRLFGEKEPALAAEARPEHIPHAVEEPGAAAGAGRPARAHPGMEPAQPEAHARAHPGTEPALAGAAHAPETAMPDISLAKQIVRHALDTHLPEGAMQAADVQKVLDGVAARVAPALTHLHAQEFNPGKEKAEGAIGFTARAREPSGKESLIASVRITAKRKMSHEDIRDRALIAMARGLQGQHTYTDSEAILNRLGERLRPEGVKGFELSPASEDGQIDISVNINPKYPLGKLVSQATSMPEGRSVKASIELTMTTAREVKPAVLPAASERTNLPGAQILEQKEDKRIVQMVSWNTSDIYTYDNDSHAEHQFVEWLKKSEQQHIRQDLEEVKIVMDRFSPCSKCSQDLAALLREIKVEQAGKHAASLPAAHLYWKQLYTGASKKTQGALPTTWEGIGMMRGAGWELHAPHDQWPAEQKSGSTIKGLQRYEGEGLWRLVPIEEPEQVSSRQAPVIRRRGGAVTSAVKEPESE